MSGYSPEQVAVVIEWIANDGSWASEYRPTEGMPRAKSNPARSGNAEAMIADVRRALWTLAEEARNEPEPDLVDDVLAVLRKDIEPRRAMRDRMLDVGVTPTRKDRGVDSGVKWPWVEVGQLDFDAIGPVCSRCNLEMPTCGVCDCD